MLFYPFNLKYRSVSAVSDNLRLLPGERLWHKFVKKMSFFSSKDSSKSKYMLFLNNIRFTLMLCIVIMPGILVIDMHLAFKISPFETWYSDTCGILNVE